MNLGRLLQSTLEFLQNQVLSSVLKTDAEAEAIESKQSQTSLAQ